MKLTVQKCPRCNGLGKVPSSDTGKSLMNERLSLGLSREVISKEMKVSQGYLRDLELGKRNWSDERVTQFQSALTKFGARK